MNRSSKITRVFVLAGLPILMLVSPVSYGITKSCGLGASGNACVFDLQATANGLVTIDTRASLAGQRWRGSIFRVLTTGACGSGVGTGSTAGFTGPAQCSLVSGQSYEVVINYERPLPGTFPATVTARFNGPVIVSEARPRINGARVLTPRYSGVHTITAINLFSLGISADGLRITNITADVLICAFHPDSFSVNLSPGIPIEIGPNGQRRFARQDIPIVLPGQTHTHALDIDGVFFDADGFGGTPEQGLGGISFLSGLSRCNGIWTASTSPGRDLDGWSDDAEGRFGSSPNSYQRTPEHRLIPTTVLRGAVPCLNFQDDDLDGLFDGADPGCQ